jgi:hypothetical protein
MPHGDGADDEFPELWTATTVCVACRVKFGIDPRHTHSLNSELDNKEQDGSNVRAVEKGSVKIRSDIMVIGSQNYHGLIQAELTANQKKEKKKIEVGINNEKKQS